MPRSSVLSDPRTNSDLDLQTRVDRKDKSYPVFDGVTPMLIGLKLAGRRTLVIGNGAESDHRISQLSAHGAQVNSIGIEAALELDDEGLSTFLKDYFVVVLACRSPTLAATLKEQSTVEKFLFCAIDDPENCDFYNVSTRQRGRLTIAVSTSGVSPSYSSYLADRMISSFSASQQSALDAVASLRRHIKKTTGTTFTLPWRAVISQAELLTSKGYTISETVQALSTIYCPDHDCNLRDDVESQREILKDSR